MIVMEGAIRRQLSAVVYVAVNSVAMSGYGPGATAKLQSNKENTPAKSNEA
jgi:hypothetical protein